MGEIIAALAFAIGVIVLLVALILQLGAWVLDTTTWLWKIAGGDTSSPADSSSARAAWVGVAVGIVTTVLLALTLAYTHITAQTALISAKVALRAADTAERLGHRQIRAYIGAHSFTISIIRPSDYATPPTIAISLTNSGQTPALGVRYRMGWMPDEPTDIEHILEHEYHSVQDIGAGQSIEQEIPCDSWAGEELMATFYESKYSWSQGTIVYKDVFGESHQTFFRYRIHGNAARGTLSLHWELAQTGNGSD